MLGIIEKFKKKCKLHKAIAYVQEEVSNEISSVNSGGCGMFALFMHVELNKLGIASEIVIVDRSEMVESKKEIINQLMNNKVVSTSRISDTSFSHCLVRCGNMIFDSDEFTEEETLQKRYNVGTYSLAELSIALAVGGWNNTYDRAQNARMREIISETLGKSLGNPD